MNNVADIGIVIPVYNIVNYLKHCLDSIQNQTWKSFSVYLIDDGSTDGSAELIDKFCESDKRFKVFHTQNQGVSSARNYGLSQVKEPYVTFIDGDDWVHFDYCKKLLTTIKEKKADMVACNFTFCFEDGVNKESDFYPEGKYNSKDALKIIATTSSASWGKIYSMTFVEQLVFPVEFAIGEDTAMLINFLSHKHNVYFIKDSLYYYFIRENSAMRSRIDKKCINEINSGIWNRQKILDIYPDLRDVAEYRLSNNLHNVVVKITNASTDEKKKEKKDIYQIWKLFKKNYHLQLFNQYISNRIKMRLLLFYIHPKLYSRCKYILLKIKYNKERQV